jgi:hypothetical protein
MYDRDFRWIKAIDKFDSVEKSLAEAAKGQQNICIMMIINKFN